MYDFLGWYNLPPHNPPLHNLRFLYCVYVNVSNHCIIQHTIIYKRLDNQIYKSLMTQDQYKVLSKYEQHFKTAELSYIRGIYHSDIIILTPIYNSLGRAVAMTLAISVLPTPAAPSISRGRPSCRATNSTVARVSS